MISECGGSLMNYTSPTSWEWPSSLYLELKKSKNTSGHRPFLCKKKNPTWFQSETLDFSSKGNRWNWWDWSFSKPRLEPHFRNVEVYWIEIDRSNVSSKGNRNYLGLNNSGECWEVHDSNGSKKKKPPTGPKEVTPNILHICRQLYICRNLKKHPKLTLFSNKMMTGFTSWCISPPLWQNHFVLILCWYRDPDQFPWCIISVEEAWIQIYPKQIRRALRFHVERWLLVEGGVAARLSPWLARWVGACRGAVAAAALPHIHIHVVRDWENNLNWNVYPSDRKTDLPTVSNWAACTSGNSWFSGEIKHPRLVFKVTKNYMIMKHVNGCQLPNAIQWYLAWKVTSYLTQVPPWRQGRCWQTGGSQFLIFLPPTASPIRSLSFESTWSFLMQPTNLLDPAALSGVSQRDETSPRNMGPNVPWGEHREEKTFPTQWIFLTTLVLATNCAVSCWGGWLQDYQHFFYIFFHGNHIGWKGKNSKAGVHFQNLHFFPFSFFGTKLGSLPIILYQRWTFKLYQKIFTVHCVVWYRDFYLNGDIKLK